MHNGRGHAGGAAILTAPDARDMLDSAVATMGGALHDWTVTQVDHRPGRSTTVAYKTRIGWPDGERTETFGAGHRPIPNPRTGLGAGRHDRVELAEQWLAAAHAGGLPDFESALIRASGPIHQR